MFVKETNVELPGLHLPSSHHFLIIEAILETKPNWVIQVGRPTSSSIFYSAHILDQIEEGFHSVISVVDDTTGLPRRRNIYYVEGDPLDSCVLSSIRELILPKDKVMVVLEEGRHWAGIAGVNTYAPFVSAGCYLVVDEKSDTELIEQMTFDSDWRNLKPQMYLRKCDRKGSCEIQPDISG